MRWRLAMVLVFGLGCQRACSAEPPADAGTSDGGAGVTEEASRAKATRVLDAATDAALTAEQRQAYSAALVEGRKATVAKRWGDATTAFDRALAIIPSDARALSERGYAQLLGGHPEAAKHDFQRARSACDPKDTKLAAQIEFNLGLACDALADTGVDDQLRGEAVGHYRRSNDLAPSKAAAAKMGGCPASWGPAQTATFGSRDDVEAKLSAPRAEWEEQGDPTGVFVHRDPTHTDVLLPIDAGRWAHVVVGSTALWHCGWTGELAVEKVGPAWKLTYQSHRNSMSAGLCFCTDGVACDAPGGAPSGGAKCACADPACPMVCGGAESPEGDHTVTFVDLKTGAGVWHTHVDHAYLGEVTFDVDLSTRRFHATGLGCIADIALPK